MPRILKKIQAPTTYVSIAYLLTCLFLSLEWEKIIPRRLLSYKGDNFFIRFELTFTLALFFTILLQLTEKAVLKNIFQRITFPLITLSLSFLLSLSFSFLFAFAVSGYDTDIISFYYFISGIATIGISLLLMSCYRRPKNIPSK